MGIQINKEAYTKLINEDIEVLEKHIPFRSLEKSHIIDVLRWSIERLYSDNNKEILTDNKE